MKSKKIANLTGKLNNLANSASTPTSKETDDSINKLSRLTKEYGDCKTSIESPSEMVSESNTKVQEKHSAEEEERDEAEKEYTHKVYSY